MPKVNNTKLSEALEVFIKAMRPYVKDVISKAANGQFWEEALYNELNQSQQRLWNDAKSSLTKSCGNLVDLIDYYNLPTFGIKFKDALRNEVGGRNFDVNKLIHYFKELNDVRHRLLFQSLKAEDLSRAFLNMKDCAEILEMQDLLEAIRKIEVERPQTIVDLYSTAMDNNRIASNHKPNKDIVIRDFEQEEIVYRKDVFGYELRIHGETYFLIFGYKKKFAYCDLIADRVGQPLPKEDKLIRERLFDEKRTPKTQPSYLIKKFSPTTTEVYGKDFLDKILKILKEN